MVFTSVLGRIMIGQFANKLSTCVLSFTYKYFWASHHTLLYYFVVTVHKSVESFGILYLAIPDFPVLFNREPQSKILRKTLPKARRLCHFPKFNLLFWIHLTYISPTSWSWLDTILYPRYPVHKVFALLTCSK